MFIATSIAIIGLGVEILIEEGFYMSLSGEGYFPKKDWFDALPGSKTQHEDVIASDVDAREESGILLTDAEASAADAALELYAASFGISDANASRPDQVGDLAMPVSEARQRVEAEVGPSVVAEVVEFPDQQAA